MSIKLKRTDLLDKEMPHLEIQSNLSIKSSVSVVQTITYNKAHIQRKTECNRMLEKGTLR